MLIASKGLLEWKTRGVTFWMSLEVRFLNFPTRLPGWMIVKKLSWNSLFTCCIHKQEINLMILFWKFFCLRLDPPLFLEIMYLKPLKVVLLFSFFHYFVFMHNFLFKTLSRKLNSVGSEEDFAVFCLYLEFFQYFRGCFIWFTSKFNKKPKDDINYKLSHWNDAK